MISKRIESQVQKQAGNVYRFCASDQSIDRDGDQIMLSAWQTDAYERNNVILWGHQQSTPAIGKGKLTRDTANGRLLVDVSFPTKGSYELADTVRTLVAEGIIQAVSVGFRGTKWDPMPNGGRKYTECELLEISICNVPANASALAVAAKQGVITDRQAKLMEKNIEIDLEAIELPKVNRYPWPEIIHPESKIKFR